MYKDGMITGIIYYNVITVHDLKKLSNPVTVVNDLIDKVTGYSTIHSGLIKYTLSYSCICLYQCNKPTLAWLIIVL